MPTELIIVDAFTAMPFRGNPAAVCLLEEPADEEWMRDVAREMNLSETAFCHPEGDGSGTLHLRWLTPAVEVDLCGHATLATAHVLATERGVTGTIRFATRSGILTATVDGNDGIVLDFPADPPAAADPPDGMLAALGIADASVFQGRSDYLVEVDGPEIVRGLDPDISALARLDCRGVIVTSAGAGGDGGPDVVSRFFAPGAGVGEDPVTGSAHTTLAPHWAPRLGTTLRCHQASARGGDLVAHLDGDRVRLVGHAVTMARTTLLH